jgi:hypothetical protein
VLQVPSTRSQNLLVCARNYALIILNVFCSLSAFTIHYNMNAAAFNDVADDVVGVKCVDRHMFLCTVQMIRLTE